MKGPTSPHPPLWPYLLGVAVLLLVVAVFGTRHMQREQARWREMVAADARKRAADSAAHDSLVDPRTP